MSQVPDQAVQELRLVITARDSARSRAFFEQLLRGAAQDAWTSPEGRVVILAAGRATLEIVDEAQADRIDRPEVRRRVSGELRLALGFADSEAALARAREAVGEVVHGAVRTPWNSMNAPVLSPDGACRSPSSPGLSHPGRGSLTAAASLDWPS